MRSNGEPAVRYRYATYIATNLVILGFSRYPNVLKEIISHRCVFTPQTLVRGVFLLYRKFLKSSEMVYNELEIKNDMTKERMCWIRHDVVYEVFFVVNF